MGSRANHGPLRQRRETNEGLGGALSTPFEFGDDGDSRPRLVPTGGWDRAIFMVALTIFCVVGKSILLAATYNEKMKRLEAERGERARRTVA